MHGNLASTSEIKKTRLILESQNLGFGSQKLEFASQFLGNPKISENSCKLPNCVFLSFFECSEEIASSPLDLEVLQTPESVSDIQLQSMTPHQRCMRTLLSLCTCDPLTLNSRTGLFQCRRSSLLGIVPVQIVHRKQSNSISPPYMVVAVQVRVRVDSRRDVVVLAAGIVPQCYPQPHHLM